jgi:hypothetical protein
MRCWSPFMSTRWEPERRVSVQPSRFAYILDDDDPRERQRLIGRGDLARRLCVSASAAMDTDPLTVRVDLDPPDRGEEQQSLGVAVRYSGSISR